MPEAKRVAPGQRFAGGDDLEPAAHLVGNRLFLFQVPLAAAPIAGRPACNFAGSARYPWPMRWRARGFHPSAPADWRVPCARLRQAADRASGQDQVDCLGMADQPRQPDGAEIDQGDAKAAAEDAESGVPGVTTRACRPTMRAPCRRQPQNLRPRRSRVSTPAAAGSPHRRDRTVAADLALLVGIARGHRLEVGAGAETAAGAGEYRPPTPPRWRRRRAEISYSFRAVAPSTALRQCGRLMETMVTSVHRVSTSTASVSVSGPSPCIFSLDVVDLSLDHPAGDRLVEIGAIRARS